MIATTLPTILPPTPSCPVAIRISFYPYQIPVSYDEVRSLVPRLYSAYEDRVDLILHMGMTENRNYYSIEKLAHRDNYDAYADAYGARIDKRDGMSYWADCPPVLETSLDFDDVFQRWRSNLLDTPEVSSEQLDGVILRPSHDAGHFLCDFIYYSSLAEHWRHKKDRVGQDGVDDIDERPVIFMHVPKWAGTRDLQKGKLVTIGLLKALAQSWIIRKSGGRVGK